jgi:tetratricopeptide (TPR) repeat protein
MARRSLLFALVLGTAGALWTGPAAAEEIVLASGTRYDATDVAIVGKTVRFTFHVGGGRATVTLPFERIEPRSLFWLVAARTGRDPESQLTLGWFALEQRLLPEAASRFRKAAEGDPTLSARRDEGLAAIARVEMERLLAAAENDLRRGRFDAGSEKASRVRAAAEPGSDLATRAQGLLDLARRVEESEGRRLEAEAKARAQAQTAAENAALDAALERADKAALSAIEKRNRVSVPGLSLSRVRSELEGAEALLREARRLLDGALDLAPARREEVVARDAAALELLVATHLDLCDLHRQESRWTKAREHVRAALVLDPDNARAIEAQRLIEEALRAPPVPLDPYDLDVVPVYRVWRTPYVPFSHRPMPSVTRRFSWSGGGSGWRFFVGW